MNTPTNTRSENGKQIIGMYDLVEALENVIASSDPAMRDTLARTFDSYADDFPEEFGWAVGGQAPALLVQLMMGIGNECRPQICDECAAKGVEFIESGDTPTSDPDFSKDDEPMTEAKMHAIVAANLMNGKISGATPIPK
jgi:hypothetical protein